jgi:predicted nuclease of predicted toxin-antitoxin system
MKILLDENIDVRFKYLFPNDHFEVYTVRDMQWNGVKNGALLKLLNEHNFNSWIVVDKNLPYQQNLAALPCTIVVLNVFRNTLAQITALLPLILSQLQNTLENEVIIIGGNIDQ